MDYWISTIHSYNELILYFLTNNISSSWLRHLRHEVGTPSPNVRYHWAKRISMSATCSGFTALHEMNHGLAMRILSVCLSVRLSNAWIVTKRKKDQSRFLYHAKDHLACSGPKNLFVGPESRPIKLKIFLTSCHRRSQGVQWVHLHPPPGRWKNFFQA